MLELWEQILYNYLKLGSGIAKRVSPPARFGVGRDKFSEDPPKMSGSSSRNSENTLLTKI